MKVLMPTVALSFLSGALSHAVLQNLGVRPVWIYVAAGGLAGWASAVLAVELLSSDEPPRREKDEGSAPMPKVIVELGEGLRGFVVEERGSEALVDFVLDDVPLRTWVRSRLTAVDPTEAEASYLRSHV